MTDEPKQFEPITDLEQMLCDPPLLISLLSTLAVYTQQHLIASFNELRARDEAQQITLSNGETVDSCELIYWQACNQVLPDEGLDVLVCAYGDVWRALLDSGEWHIAGGNGPCEPGAVTHWAEMPTGVVVA
jgi:hypothetical protein